MKTPITFTKIVATPSISAWSQAYNAGNLAAVLALTQEVSKNEEGDESIPADISLASLGKELLNTLEAEYFTLETKNLNSIKQAITATCDKVADSINASVMVSVIIENVLYVFIYGSGKILMKRHGKLGTLLEQQEKNHLTAASGFIQNEDIVILETEQFANIVTNDALLPCLEHDKLTEMAEMLSPIIHERQEGSAAALAFSYREDVPLTSIKKDNFTPVAETKNEEPEPVLFTHKQADFDQFEEQVEQKPESPFLPEETSAERFMKRSDSQIGQGFSLTHRRKIFLTIAVVILLILGASIYFSIQKQHKEAMDALYASTVAPAQKKYDEGQSLIDLNKNLALQDFQDAKSILNTAAGKFPADTSQAKQIADLQKKIDDALTLAAQINAADTKESDFANSALLATLNKHSDAKYVTAGDKDIFLGNNTNIVAVSQSTGKERTVMQADWKDMGGLGAYLGNLYVVDRKDGITKYVGGSNTSKAAYFSGNAPDMTTTVDMAIDGSIWLVSSDGTVSKYTRGKSDNLTIKGLDKPLNNPTRIYTTVDLDNVYILDNGNKRVVVLDKSGNYVAQYQSGLFGQALGIDVSEKNKKLYLLVGGKLYETSLK